MALIALSENVGVPLLVNVITIILLSIGAMLPLSDSPLRDYRFWLIILAVVNFAIGFSWIITKVVEIK